MQHNTQQFAIAPPPLPTLDFTSTEIYDYLPQSSQILTFYSRLSCSTCFQLLLGPDSGFNDSNIDDKGLNLEQIIGLVTCLDSDIMLNDGYKSLMLDDADGVKWGATSGTNDCSSTLSTEYNMSIKNWFIMSNCLVGYILMLDYLLEFRCLKEECELGPEGRIIDLGFGSMIWKLYDKIPRNLLKFHWIKHDDSLLEAAKIFVGNEWLSGLPVFDSSSASTGAFPGDISNAQTLPKEPDSFTSPIGIITRQTVIQQLSRTLLNYLQSTVVRYDQFLPMIANSSFSYPIEQVDARLLEKEVLDVPFKYLGLMRWLSHRNDAELGQVPSSHTDSSTNFMPSYQYPPLDVQNNLASISLNDSVENLFKVLNFGEKNIDAGLAEWKYVPALLILDSSSSKEHSKKLDVNENNTKKFCSSRNPVTCVDVLTHWEIIYLVWLANGMNNTSNTVSSSRDSPVGGVLQDLGQNLRAELSNTEVLNNSPLAKMTVSELLACASAKLKQEWGAKTSVSQNVKESTNGFATTCYHTCSSETTFRDLLEFYAGVARIADEPVKAYDKSFEEMIGNSCEYSANFNASKNVPYQSKRLKDPENDLGILVFDRVSGVQGAVFGVDLLKVLYEICLHFEERSHNI